MGRQIGVAEGWGRARSAWRRPLPVCVCVLSVWVRVWVLEANAANKKSSPASMSPAKSNVLLLLHDDGHLPLLFSQCKSTDTFTNTPQTTVCSTRAPPRPRGLAGFIKQAEI